jgi:hypothetical protein
MNCYHKEVKRRAAAAKRRALLDRIAAAEERGKYLFQNEYDASVAAALARAAWPQPEPAAGAAAAASAAVSTQKADGERAPPRAQLPPLEGTEEARRLQEARAAEVEARAAEDERAPAGQAEGHNEEGGDKKEPTHLRRRLHRKGLDRDL